MAKSKTHRIANAADFVWRTDLEADRRCIGEGLLCKEPPGSMGERAHVSLERSDGRRIPLMRLLAGLWGKRLRITIEVLADK